MRTKPTKQVEKYRVIKGLLKSDKSFGNNGLFLIPYKKSFILNVVVSDQDGWDHVSVSHPKFIPTWSMMCFVKDLFFQKDETVVQYHPKEADYINYHKHCLHLWRPHYIPLPAPPTWMVGPEKGDK